MVGGPSQVSMAQAGGSTGTPNLLTPVWAPVSQGCLWTATDLTDTLTSWPAQLSHLCICSVPLSLLWVSFPSPLQVSDPLSWVPVLLWLAGFFSLSRCSPVGLFPHPCLDSSSLWVSGPFSLGSCPPSSVSHLSLSLSQKNLHCSRPGCSYVLGGRGWAPGGSESAMGQRREGPWGC